MVFVKRNGANNQIKDSNMNISLVLNEFFFALKADGYSTSTIDLYRNMLKNFYSFIGDKAISKITPKDLTCFFAYLRCDYIPRRQSGNDSPLSGSTLQNHWKAIRCFFRWALEEHSLKSRPDLKLKLPSNNPREIMPLSEKEVKLLVEAAQYSRQVVPSNRQGFRMSRPTAERDTALIVLLLDTGIRSGEASRLRIKDVDLVEGEIFILPYGSSRRKTKSRIIPLGRTTSRYLKQYLSTRPNATLDEPLFLTISSQRMTRGTIRLLLRRLGEKTGIRNCHPHRLRHTFAIEYLRNKGDIFSLQMILGHNSLEMVRHYLQLVNADTKNAHKLASPADKWNI